MKTVTVDFTNSIVQIKAKKYQDTKSFDSFRKEFLESFFPAKKYMEDYNSYTWDFDANVFIVNQDKRTVVTPAGEYRYYPELIIPVQNLSKKYLNFMDIVMSI